MNNNNHLLQKAIIDIFDFNSPFRIIKITHQRLSHNILRYFHAVTVMACKSRFYFILINKCNAPNAKCEMLIAISATWLNPITLHPQMLIKATGRLLDLQLLPVSFEFYFGFSKEKPK